jgi:DNA adenine methylase
MKDMDVYILENQVDRTKGIDALMGWIGGKSQLRAELAARMPEQDVPVSKRKLKYYVEVFGGMAWLLLYRPRWFEYEIYNDFNGDIVNLMTIIKEHPIEFWRNLKMIPNSEKYYNHMINNEGLADVQRAVATYIKYAWSFSSSGESYSARAVSKLGV